MFNTVNEDELRYYLSTPINKLSKIEQAKRPLVVALYNAKQDYSSIGLKAFDKVEDIGEGFKVGVDVLNPYYKYIIKPDGTLINEVFHYVDKFSEGTCQVSYSRAIRKDPYIKICRNHIDTNGKMVFEHNQFVHVGRFVDGIACVCIGNGKWNYIDKTGKVLFPQYDFSNTFGFENGWGEVRREHKEINYMNKDGEFRFSEWKCKKN
jgi:hypothetical protein